eukprot:3184531-Prymnesium_polylepis.1
MGGLGRSPFGFKPGSCAVIAHVADTHATTSIRSKTRDKHAASWIAARSFARLLLRARVRRAARMPNTQLARPRREIHPRPDPSSTPCNAIQ